MPVFSCKEWTGINCCLPVWFWFHCRVLGVLLIIVALDTYWVQQILPNSRNLSSTDKWLWFILKAIWLRYSCRSAPLRVCDKYLILTQLNLFSQGLEVCPPSVIKICLEWFDCSSGNTFNTSIQHTLIRDDVSDTVSS